MANNLRDLLVLERDSLKKKLEAVVNMLSTLDRIPDAVIGSKKRGRKPMSAAARKAQSVKMKKFWAAKRKEKK